MRKHVVVLALGAIFLAAPVAAQSQEGSAGEQGCTPVKKVYAEKNWRDSTPQDGKQVCWRAASPLGAGKTIQHFKDYRHYRLITPYRCLSGREGTFAIPCYIIECESHFNWWAMNSSGASYIYQLLGWGAPPPSSFKNRLKNHEIAASLSLSNWACA